MLFLKQFYTEDEFNIEIVGNGVLTEECANKIKDSDLIIYTSSLFHFSVHHQTMLFLESLQNECGNELVKKPFTYFTTSIHNMDVIAHKYVKTWALSNMCKYIQSLPAKDIDLLTEEGRNALCAWFNFVKAKVENNSEIKFNKNNRVVLLDTTDGDNSKISESIKKAQEYYINAGATVDIINLRDYNIHSCISCSACYTDCVCILNDKDDYMKLIKEVYQDKDIVIYFGEERYGMLGEKYKVYLDRHVQFGRHEYPVTDIMNYIKDDLNDKSYMSDWSINGYIIETSEDETESDLSAFEAHTDAMNSFGGDVLAGIYNLTTEHSLNGESLDEFFNSIVLLSNEDVRPIMDSYGDSIHRKFRDLAWELQVHTPRDYNFYNEQDCYKQKELNEHIVAVHSVEEGLRMRKGRLMPYKMAIALIKNGWKPNLDTRRHLIGTLPPIVGETVKNKTEQESKENKLWKLFTRK
jgi:hypothetical protein